MPKTFVTAALGLPPLTNFTQKDVNKLLKQLGPMSATSKKPKRHHSRLQQMESSDGMDSCQFLNTESKLKGKQQPMAQESSEGIQSRPTATDLLLNSPTSNASRSKRKLTIPGSSSPLRNTFNHKKSAKTTLNIH